MVEPSAPSRTLRIVLVGPRNPLNIGAAARAMANFGLDDLVLVHPYAKAWLEVRSARAGAALLRSARIAVSLPEAVAGCDWVVGTTAGTARTPELPLEDWSLLAAALPATRVALLFGSEKTGLSVEDISHCHRLARIATVPGAPSMNLGQAVAVCAYEWTRGAPAAPLPAEASIAAPERERLLQTWYPILEQIGAVLPAHRASQTRALREMLVRWRLLPQDETRLLGLARQVRHALARRPSGGNVP
ncbi:MAG TPA: RNA methyltransferase [Terriglobales bacterium]|nr:RNA methyltransferase [Terriglobales bacterium]